MIATATEVLLLISGLTHRGVASAVGTDNAEGVIDTLADLVTPCKSQSFDVRVGVGGLAAFSPTPITKGSSSTAPTRSLRSTGLHKPKPTRASNAPTKAGPKPRQKTAHRDDSAETSTNTKSMLTSSSRLGGGDLRAFRDTVGTKRADVDGVLDRCEASFAKAKRTRALGASDELKQKISSIQAASSGFGGSIMKVMLFLREEN
ncbi:hypothetical protein DVH05_017263 [Phytophthora capsici]|nr:hypothetical protein DVH05_017263 [Phytophthora capsici]